MYKIARLAVMSETDRFAVISQDEEKVSNGYRNN
jgi:hypothetical protein